MIETLKYKRLGAHYCVPCFEETENMLFRIEVDWEDTFALRREVSKCDRCGALAIGEKIPPGMSAYFDQFPGSSDPPVNPLEPVEV